MTMRELRNELNTINATTEGTTPIKPTITNNTYCNWATCFIESVMINTFGEVYSSTVLRVNDEHIAFQSGEEGREIILKIDFASNYDAGYEKCLCWELSILHNNEFDKLSSGYTVVDTYMCKVVDCIMN